MSKKYFLGIDGGGTKTKVFVIDENKTELYQGVAGPSTVDQVSKINSIKAINDALLGFKEKITFSAVFAGLGGIQSPSEEKDFAKEMIKINGCDKNTKFYARNDSYNALATSLSFDEGISLISGTGMNCFGVDKQGNYHFAGGLGFKEGDLGSAFSLGFLAMRSLARVLDGRTEKTKMHEDLIQITGVDNTFKIKDFFNNFTENRTNIASLAVTVNKHADKGEQEAIRICDLGATELGKCVKAVLNHINLDKKTVTIVGGLGNSLGYYRTRLIDEILKVDKDITVLAPKIDPGLAAAYLALHYYEHNK